MRRRTLVVVGLMALVLLNACSSKKPNPTTVISTSASPVATASARSSSAVPKESAGAASASPGEIPGITFFQTPTKNIGCLMTAEYARCDIREHSWKAPPKPKSCDLDWGNGVSVEAGRKSQFVCAGDTVLGQGSVVAYGGSKRVGSISCAVAETGVVCADRSAGHGFQLGRTSYRLL